MCRRALRAAWAAFRVAGRIASVMSLILLAPYDTASSFSVTFVAWRLPSECAPSERKPYRRAYGLAAELSRWGPAVRSSGGEHKMFAVDVAEPVLAPRAGGRVYDRGVDGCGYEHPGSNCRRTN